MAEIVVLNKWRADKPRRPQIRIGEIEDAGQVGQVVLFTGVRYERFDDRTDRKAENHAVCAE
ncbi:hypothetical protein KX729_07235 [Rhizobium sp. XQZ8]|uniref:hypothetical protein n=1 Tax=Rhizobium populisoli TaxID=2859785 RepID=UPI001CA5C5F1|nr:hypothetical protein [Rhizobium populisoli]MBW6421232.1 hypothetical protein [Rhizobium populisoli]